MSERKDVRISTLLHCTGGEIMKPSSFESAIRLQFDCLIRKVIDRTVKNYYRELGRRAKHKIPFCDVTEMDLNHAGVMFQMTSRGIVYD